MLMSCLSRPSDTKEKTSVTTLKDFAFLLYNSKIARFLQVVLTYYLSTFYLNGQFLV